MTKMGITSKINFSNLEISKELGDHLRSNKIKTLADLSNKIDDMIISDRLLAEVNLVLRKYISKLFGGNKND